MKNIIIFAFFISSAASAQSVDIPITNITQQASSWGSLAISEQIIDYLDTNTSESQCQLSAQITHVAEVVCCFDDKYCQTNEEFSVIKSILNRKNISFIDQSKPDNPKDLYQVLVAGHPIIVRYNNRYVLVRGLFYKGNVPYVAINDPSEASTTHLTFEILKTYWRSGIQVMLPSSNRFGSDTCANDKKSCINNVQSKYNCYYMYSDSNINPSTYWEQSCVENESSMINDCQADYSVCKGDGDAQETK